VDPFTVQLNASHNMKYKNAENNTITAQSRTMQNNWITFRTHS